MQKKFKKMLGQTETYVFLIIVLLAVMIQVRSGQFFTGNNIIDLVTALIVPGLFACGTFMVLVSGGIDVAFPALASLCAYATTKLFLEKFGFETLKDLPDIEEIDTLIGRDEDEEALETLDALGFQQISLDLNE